MVQSKLIYATSARVDEIPIANGQVIFVPDIDTVYLDMQNIRHIYSLIHVCETQEERTSLEPQIGFYFVESDNTLWRWKYGWKRLTHGNSNPVIYGETKEEFPVSGEEEKLYFTDKGIYNWKEQMKKYNLIANANTWEDLQ